MTLKEQFLEVMKNFMESDFSKSPNFITIKRLHEELVKNGFNGDEASTVLGKLDIQVNSEFVEDKELFDTTIIAYVDAIKRIKSVCDEVNRRLFWEVIKNPGLVLKYGEE